MKRSTHIALFLTIILSGCIGTDRLNDEITRVNIQSEKTATLIGGEIEFSAFLENQFGDFFTAPVVWKSSDETILMINSSGHAQAIAKGQVMVVAQYDHIISNEVLITVVESENDPAEIRILTDVSTVAVGDTIQFMAEVTNILGEVLHDLEVEWSSSEPQVFNFFSSGNGVTVMEGISMIKASSGMIMSPIKNIEIGSAQNLEATFSGLNGYTVSGMAVLSQSGPNLVLKFKDNFNAQPGPGLFVYLSNNMNSVAGGREISTLKANSGSQVYEIANTDINAFQFVIIHCKPFNVPFGAGKFE